MATWLRILGWLAVALGLGVAAWAGADLAKGSETSGLEKLCRQGNAYACRMIEGVETFTRTGALAVLVSGLLFGAFFGSLFFALAALIERTRPGSPLELRGLAEEPAPRRAEPRL